MSSAVQESKVSASYWKLRGGFDFENMHMDDASLKYEFDVHAYTSKLLKAMAEIEEDAAEPIVIDWLRKRGWTVERK